MATSRLARVPAIRVALHRPGEVREPEEIRVERDQRNRDDRRQHPTGAGQ